MTGKTSCHLLQVKKCPGLVTIFWIKILHWFAANHKPLLKNVEKSLFWIFGEIILEGSSPRLLLSLNPGGIEGQQEGSGLLVIFMDLDTVTHWSFQGFGWSFLQDLDFIGFSRDLKKGRSWLILDFDCWFF